MISSNMKKRSLLGVLILSITLLISGISVSAEETSVNLINSKTDILQMTDAEYKDGVFTMSNPVGEYLASFSVPGLTNDYTWSGDIKILEFSSDRAPNGVRFCVGYDAVSGDFLNLIVTKSIGIAAERKGTHKMNDVYKLTKEDYDKVINNGSQFHFEIIKKGPHVIMKIDDTVAMDYVFPDEFDLFREGEDYNLGFYAVNCSYEVRNLVVYDKNVKTASTTTNQPAASALPSTSSVKTASPALNETSKITAKATNSLQTPDVSQKSTSKNDNNTKRMEKV